MLHLSLFGTGRARHGERVLARFPNHQPHLLLCYLALARGQFRAREILATLFWGDYPTAASRKYLRNALWRLRHALLGIGVPAEDYLLVRDDTVALSSTVPLYLDTELFEDNVTRYQHVAGRDLAPDEAKQLEDAARLYTGHLLEGVYEDWCVYERERFLLMYLKALSMLMDFHEATGTYDRGLDHGNRILACDNTRENVHRQMMRMHYLSGDRSAALAQYNKCAQIMRQALHLAPTAETQRLYDQIARDDFAAAAAVPAGSPGRARPGERSSPGLEEALRRLHRVEAQLQRASQELRSVASLIQSLSAGDPPDAPAE
jgi:DNA-binding SARP family transcriptional activator